MSQPLPEPLTTSAADERRLNEPPASARRSRSFLAELPVLMLIAFGLALLLKTFLVQAFFIPSRSMEPTLLVGDRVLVNKVVYELRDPRRGEVVVFTHSDGGLAVAEDEGNVLERLLDSLASGLGLASSGERDFIKRVIGLPGDTVEVRQGVVYVNGQELPEASTTDGGYLSMRDRGDFAPVTVRPDHYFLMGDNRPNSDDSRGSLGQISRQEIVGRAFVIIWPIPNVDTLPIAEYSSPAQREVPAVFGMTAADALPSGLADDDAEAVSR
ncbi:MAG: signal peptidase I [Egibacteraceae bacterium]